MGLPGDWKEGGGLAAPYGVVVGLLSGDLKCSHSLERAPDSGGSPDLGNISVIATLDPTPQRYIDLLPNDKAVRWYRFRHTKKGYTVSNYTAWVSRAPTLIPKPLPPLPVYPLTYVEIQEPDTAPSNVVMRLQAWPDHQDIVWRWADLGLSTAVPPRSEDSSVWTFYPNSTSAIALCSTFSASFTPGENLTFKDYNGLTTATGVLVDTDDATYVMFNLSTGWPRRSDTISGDSSGTTCDIDEWEPPSIARDASDPKRIAVWAELNGIYGPITIAKIGPDLTPQVLNVAYSQLGSGTTDDACVRAKVDLDKQAQLVRVYARTASASATSTASFTYNENSPSADSITRSTGSFITDGFVAGVVRASGTTNNNKEVEVATVAALTMTLVAADDLTQEGPVSSTIEQVAWPTIDEKSDGALDEDYYKGSLKSQNPEFQDCGYSTNDVVHHIFLPLTGTGQSSGARWAGDGAASPVGFRVTGTATPQITQGSRVPVQDGTNCSSQRQDKVSWVSSGTNPTDHDMRVFVRVTSWGGPSPAWTQVATTDMSTDAGTLTVDMQCFADAGSSRLVCDIKLQIYDTTGAHIEDELILVETELFNGIKCLGIL